MSRRLASRCATSRTVCRSAAAVLALLTAVLLGPAAWGQPGGAVLVDVAPVVQRDISSRQTFVGTVRPLRHSTIGSAVDGRVLEFPVNEGDRVSAGQTLAQLRTKRLELMLAAAKATAELRRFELDELKNGSRPEEIAKAEAEMRAARALVDYTASRLRRFQGLFQRGVSTEEEIDDAVSRAEQAQQVYLSAKATYDLTVAGPRREKLAQAEAQLVAATEEANRIQDEIDRHTVTAPFDGFVVAEHTEVGAWVKSGDPIVEVIELDQVDVEIPVPEQIVAQLQVGTPALVELDALPGVSFSGQVALIVPRADERSRSFPVKVRVANELVEGRPRIKPGMFARVGLAIGSSQGAVLVPKDALVLGGPAPVVYVVDPGPGGTMVVRRVAVQPGLADDGMIEVIGGLRPGERVITRGNERLRPGQQVAIAGP